MLHEDEKINNRQEPRGLQDSYLDFRLSRQAMLCTEQTMAFYTKTLGKFILWLEEEGIDEPVAITSRHIHTFIAAHKERGCSDSYVHTFARSIRTYIRYLHEEGYISKPVHFQMPRVGSKRLLVLSAEEVQRVLDGCENIRDRAIIMFLVDTGLRRGEICDLSWGDLDLSSGICLVRNGKGKQARTVVVGIYTRRILLKYKQTISSDDNDPLFQVRGGGRLSPGGLRSICVRLSERTGIHITPHALRRTFVVLCLKSGMSLAHVQALMGHSTPTMTLAYAQLVDDDLLTAHQQHGPVDTLLSKK